VYVCLVCDPAAVTDITENTDSENENEDTAASSDGNYSEEEEARPAVEAKKSLYDKTLCCFYCKKILKRKMLRHLRRVHANEAEVAEALVCKDRQQRILEITQLTNLGNFNHNCKVIEAGVGDLIVKKDTLKDVPLQDKIDAYLPCVYCCAFYMKQYLWRHLSCCRCKQLADDVSTRNIVGRSRLMLRGSVGNKTLGVDPVFKKEVLDSMRFDEVTRTALNDEVILKYGKSLHRRLGRSKSRANDIAQRMRKLARVMLHTKATGSVSSPSEADENIPSEADENFPSEENIHVSDNLTVGLNDCGSEDSCDLFLTGVYMDCV